MKKTFVIAFLAAVAVPLAALASGTHAGSHDMPASHGNMSASEHAALFGQPGDPARVTRTVDVVLDDDMRFHPSSIDVKVGDTVRFVVRNAGKVRHEMVLGSLDELKEHAVQMRAHPGMVHSVAAWCGSSPSRARSTSRAPNRDTLKPAWSGKSRLRLELGLHRATFGGLGAQTPGSGSGGLADRGARRRGRLFLFSRGQPVVAVIAQPAPR